MSYRMSIARAMSDDYQKASHMGAKTDPQESRIQGLCSARTPSQKIEAIGAALEGRTLPGEELSRKIVECLEGLSAEEILSLKPVGGASGVSRYGHPIHKIVHAKGSTVAYERLLKMIENLDDFGYDIKKFEHTVCRVAEMTEDHNSALAALRVIERLPFTGKIKTTLEVMAAPGYKKIEWDGTGYWNATIRYSAQAILQEAEIEVEQSGEVVRIATATPNPSHQDNSWVYRA